LERLLVGGIIGSRGCERFSAFPGVPVTNIFTFKAAASAHIERWFDGSCK
jgi:tRNA isopentenyl-2-thiomethyl-A-37 hydroxylase MiaE